MATGKSEYINLFLFLFLSYLSLPSPLLLPPRLFFVIECVNGGDMMFHMQRHRRLPEEHARFYSAEISLALNFLHDRGACVCVCMIKVVLDKLKEDPRLSLLPFSLLLPFPPPSFPFLSPLTPRPPNSLLYFFRHYLS